jgi:hypothetical protein
MKRFWTVLLVVAVALVMALPAGAKPDKPDKPGKPPPDEPLIGLTCDQAAAEYRFDHVNPDWNSAMTEFTVVLGVRESACVDVTSAVEGDWTIEVAWGTALAVSLGVQDSVAPGDACWGGCAGGGVITRPEPGELEGPYRFRTPASTLNACDFDLKDPDFEDGDEALTFDASASYKGPAKAAVPATITVTLPEGA